MNQRPSIHENAMVHRVIVAGSFRVTKTFQALVVTNFFPSSLHNFFTRLRPITAAVEIPMVAPDEWRQETAVVRLGSRVTIDLPEGEREFLFIGLSGPSAPEHVLTPGTPLGTAILGRRIGETATYRPDHEEFKAVIRRCLVPGESPMVKEGEVGRVRFFAGADELEEANRVAFAFEAIGPAGIQVTLDDYFIIFHFLHPNC